MARTKKKVDASPEAVVVTDSVTVVEVHPEPAKLRGRAKAPPKPRAPKPAPETPAPETPALFPPPPMPESDKLPLFEAIAQQGRDAKERLAAVLEECGKAAREIEALREQAKAAKRQLAQDAEGLREQAKVAQQHLAKDAEATRHALAEAREAVEANRKLLHGAREGLAALSKDCATAASEVASLRAQSTGAATEARDANRVAAEAGKQLLIAQEHVFKDLKQETAGLREKVQAAEQSLGRLPAQADELYARIASAGGQVRALKDSVEAARRKRDEVEQEIQTARVRLETARKEAAEAEGRLSSLRLELEDSLRRVEYAKQQVGHAAAAPAPEPEHRDRLGLTVAPGVVVAEIEAGSPAEAAGLTRGDLITTVSGTPVVTGPQLRELVQARSGEELVFKVARGAASEEASFHLPAIDPASDHAAHLGVTVSPGVVVAEVEPGSPAAEAGLVAGDVIASVNGEAAVSGMQVRELVRGLEKDAVVVLRYRRGDEEREGRARLA